MSVSAPTFADVLAAKQFLAAHIAPTPLARVFIVRAGGGSGVGGACLVAKAADPKITVIGVQSDGAPGASLSWRDRAPRETERINTFAEGLATRTAFDLPQRMMRELLD